ncbi:5-(carboxyamino)imidazole ribonucleotide mutase, partial [bacterium]|nr:5-(carboxyamino)imidazole ribonucleotide mutase [bacterium]
VEEHVRAASERGVGVFICGAGMAAHLAGAVSAHTHLPVIGVPLSGSALQGTDALHATVQMPKGVPVATVAIDGSYNAGILAVQMLALSDDKLARKLVEYKQGMVQKIEEANQKVQEHFS